MDVYKTSGGKEIVTTDEDAIHTDETRRVPLDTGRARVRQVQVYAPRSACNVTVRGMAQSVDRNSERPVDTRVTTGNKP